MFLGVLRVSIFMKLFFSSKSFGAIYWRDESSTDPTVCEIVYDYSVLLSRGVFVMGCELSPNARDRPDRFDSLLVLSWLVLKIFASGMLYFFCCKYIC